MSVRSIQKAGNVVIANGAAVSGAIEIPVGFVIVGIETPSAWTAADIGFQISTDGGTTFVNAYSGVSAATARARLTGVETGQATFVAVGSDAGLSSFMRNLGLGVKVKLTSINTASNADVNQGAERTLGVWIGMLF